MISLDDAFKKFKSRLELNDREQQDVSRRHKKLRGYVGESFSVKRDILTGSYARHTKTKPLKDVDIFFILDREDEGAYLEEPSARLLDDLLEALVGHYSAGRVEKSRRCVTVDFDTRGQDDRVLSMDAVPAFPDGDHYKIADPSVAEDWIQTDPEYHARLTTEANDEFSGEWKPMVKMLKRWNEEQDKPITPSFLVEVMALDLLHPPFTGGYVYEIKSFFANAAGRLRETWEDPAGLGAPVSDRMDEPKCRTAERALRQAGGHVDEAIQHKRQDRNGKALRVWREEIFGDLFPLS